MSALDAAEMRATTLDFDRRREQRWVAASERYAGPMIFRWDSPTRSAARTCCPDCANEYRAPSIEWSRG